YSWGWDDPFWGGDIDSYVEYHSQIDLHIRAAGTNAPLFDGRAQARSDTNRLDVLVPSLVDAMFTGFPGRNGGVVKITIPTRPPKRRPMSGSDLGVSCFDRYIATWRGRATSRARRAGVISALRMR